MIFDKYLIFTNIMCNNCILSNIYIGTKEGVSKRLMAHPHFTTHYLTSLTAEI